MYQKRWTILSSKIEECDGIFRIRKDTVLMPKNKKEYTVYSLSLSDWVNVIAITNRQEVVMVKQYRHGIRDFTMELPGGVIDPDDTPENGARRELMEETGFAVSNLTLLGTTYPNPAIQTNKCYTFLGTDAKKISGQNLDELEDIEVITIPLKDIPHLISDGVITHALIIAAFCFLFVKYPEFSFSDSND